MDEALFDKGYKMPKLKESIILRVLVKSNDLTLLMNLTFL